MKRILLCAGIVLPVLCGIREPLASPEDLERTWQAFYSTGLDTSRAMAVDHLVLQKDAMTLTLEQGVLVPMLPIDGMSRGRCSSAKAALPPSRRPPWTPGT